MMIDAYLLPVIGEYEKVQIDADSLDDARVLIQCEWVETLTICPHGNKRLCLLLDEEGKLHMKPFNFGISRFDFIAGNAILTAYDDEGDLVPVDSEDLALALYTMLHW